jgi:hypothetical protein
MTVNGTEDGTLEWEAVNWRLHEDNVRRLRRRIFKAAKEQDLATVRSLQKMMLRSWSNTLICVRQVAQRNTGRKTAGIDGEVALTPSARMVLAVRVHRSPVLMDRCHQNRVKNALEPEWEARFERQAIAAVASEGAGGMRFHDLRHAYATWLVTNGVPVNVVQRVMGHEQASTTLNRYTHTPVDYADRVLAAFAGFAAFSLPDADESAADEDRGED